MRKIIHSTLLAVALSAVALAQPGPGERPEPNLDAVITHLGLGDSQVACLEANREAFRDAATPFAQQLRELQRSLRQAARNEEDTTAIQAEIDGVRSSIEAVKASHVATAQSCLDSSQSAALAELVAAETLQQEVRQSIGLLLVESTSEGKGAAAGGPRRGRQGQRQGGQRGGQGGGQRGGQGGGRPPQ